MPAIPALSAQMPSGFMPGFTKLRALGSALSKASTRERLFNVLGPCHGTDAKSLRVFTQSPTK